MDGADARAVRSNASTASARATFLSRLSKKNGMSAAAHWSRRSRAQSGCVGRAFGRDLHGGLVLSQSQKDAVADAAVGDGLPDAVGDLGLLGTGLGGQVDVHLYRAVVADGDTLYYRGVVTCHLSLATMIIYVVERFGVALNDWLVFGVLVVLSVGQLSTLKTRKTGALLFWIPFTLLTGIGAWFWL